MGIAQKNIKAYSETVSILNEVLQKYFQNMSDEDKEKVAGIIKENQEAD
ncbi:hypothetical protein KKH82_06900 [Patescibacteria group bacterium]|nr:hypothetical protein [Patescibacteria group bacterium]